VTRRPDKDIGEERDMPNKLKVLVVGKKVGRSSAYEIAGTVSSEMGCKCQADVEVKSISKDELNFILAVLELDEEIYRRPEAEPGCQSIRSLIEKLKPTPIEEDEE
jgi:hypothetical protein